MYIKYEIIKDTTANIIPQKSHVSTDTPIFEYVQKTGRGRQNASEEKLNIDI